MLSLETLGAKTWTPAACACIMAAVWWSTATWWSVEVLRRKKSDGKSPTKTWNTKPDCKKPQIASDSNAVELCRNKLGYNVGLHQNVH